MAARAEITIDLPVPADAAVDAACRALSAAGFTLASIDPLLGIIAARTSFDPAPEDGGLDVYVQPATGTISTVILRPAAPADATSWGRLKRSAPLIADAIRQQSMLGTAQLPPPPPPGGWPPPPPSPRSKRRR